MIVEAVMTARWGFAAMLVVGSLLSVALLRRLYELDIHPFEPILNFLHRPVGEVLIVAVCVGGLVHQASTKGFLGAPMVMAPRELQTGLASEPASADAVAGMFPPYTNAVTNVCQTGIHLSETSLFLRAEWPWNIYPLPTGIEVYATPRLPADAWTAVGTAPIPGGGNRAVIEIPYSVLPDGWTISMFFTLGFNVDTDRDGLSDTFERIVSKTDPDRADTDGDGLPDGREYAHGLDPRDASDADADPDGDGLSNADELRAGTDPRNPDTDGDGLSDSREAARVEVGAQDVPWFDVTPLRVVEAPVGSSPGLVFCGTPSGLWLGNCPVEMAAADVRGVVYFGRSAATNELHGSLAPADLELDGGRTCALVAPYWGLLQASRTYRSTITFGTAQYAGCMYFVVQYADVGTMGGGLTNRVSFQVSVCEAKPDVVAVRYGELVDDRVGFPLAVGFQGGIGSDGVNRPKLGYYGGTTPGPVTNGTVIVYHLGCGGDPLVADTDGDGIPDGWEVRYGLDPRDAADADGDPDGDGLSSLGEYAHGTDPHDRDTDGDTLLDGDEVQCGTDPLNPDTDGDGLSDAQEAMIGTNPLQPDTDGDGMTDGWEFAHSSPTNSAWAVFDPRVDNAQDDDPRNDADADTDGDGLSNAEECMWNADPWNTDTDGDGVPDGEEAGAVPRGDGATGFSDPADPTDGGVPGSRIKAAFYFGDPSGSHSEKYRLEVKCVGGGGASCVRTNLRYGECETQPVALKPGCVYEVRLFHAGTNGHGEGYPDYDYTLELLDPLSTVLVEDPQRLFGSYNNDGDDFRGADRVARLYVLRNPRLVFDYDRDGKIDDADVEKAKQGKVFRFWINDDNDSGDTNDSANDIPGSGPNHGNDHVDGRCDLLDFTPVWIDTSEVFPPGTPPSILNDVVWMVRSPCVNAVWSYADRENAGAFQRQGGLYDYGSALTDLPECATVVTNLVGWEVLPSLMMEAMREDPDKGVFLIEGCAAGTELVVEGWHLSSLRLVVSNCANICIKPVEDMYWFHSLYGAESDSGFTPSRIGAPTNLWDAAVCDKDVFFTHGFRVNEQDAHAWGAEVFKRFWQSGSNARFHMFTWAGAYGWPDSGLYYPQNAYQAQMSGGALKRLIEREQTDPAKRILMTQSLGNMVACEALREGLQVAQYYMFDAALASESIDETLRVETATDPLFTKYVRPDWRDYTNVCWASNWYRFFEDDPTDARGKMKWPGRFTDALANATEVFNYYSSGDAVFTEVDGIPDLLDDVVHWDGGFNWLWHVIPYPDLSLAFENHCWQKQEVMKGMFTPAGTASGGWGFHVGPGCRYYVYDPLTGRLEAWFTPGPSDRSERFYVLDHAEDALVPVSESELTGVYHVSADSIALARLMTVPPLTNYPVDEAERMVSNGSVTNRPIFDVSGAAEMMNHDAPEEDVFLALAKHVPALSSPVGGKRLWSTPGKDIDMNNSDPDNGVPRPNGWGRSHQVFGSAWLHSDMKDVAYFYVYKLYEQLIEKGNLK